jgi:hypothetical protein
MALNDAFSQLPLPSGRYLPWPRTRLPNSSSELVHQRGKSTPAYRKVQERSQEIETVKLPWGRGLLGRDVLVGRDAWNKKINPPRLP